MGWGDSTRQWRLDEPLQGLSPANAYHEDRGLKHGEDELTRDRHRHQGEHQWPAEHLRFQVFIDQEGHRY